MQGISFNEFMKMLHGASQDGQETPEVPEASGPFAGIKHACYLVQERRKHKIAEKERHIAELRKELDSDIQVYNNLAEELEQFIAMIASANTNQENYPEKNRAFQPTDSEAEPELGHNTSWQDEKIVAIKSEPHPNPMPVENNTEASPKQKYKKKEKSTPEFKPLEEHEPTGNPRLDHLDKILHDTLEKLNNTKMAFHFKTIKRVRENLEELFNDHDRKSDEERIAELESGLRDAVDQLSTNPNAANSKVMQSLWGNIIVALKANKNDNQ